MKRRSACWAGLALATALAAAGAFAGAYVALHRPHAAWAGDHVDVVLEPGLGAGAMIERLASAGVISRPALARGWIRLRGRATSLHAGEYRFSRPASTLEVLARLAAGDVLLRPVTIPEGLAADEIVARFAAAGISAPEPLSAAFRDAAAVRDLAPEADDLEGYLFPETYHFARGTPPSRIAQALVDRFRAEALPAIADGAARVGLSLHEAVILASMVEKETALASERALVSRVFHNRLRLGMPMQCDPTVIYALHRAGRPTGTLRSTDLEFDSPWNTYRVPGLPRGPIGSPGLDSLRAAVNPVDSPALYFVALPGGGHRFSRDLAAHLRAVGEWRRYSRSSR